MKLNKKKLIMLLLILFITFIFLIAIVKIIKIPKDVTSYFNDSDIVNLNPIKIIYFEELGLDNFTCTGITYDSLNNSYWIADYGANSINDKPIPRIIEIDNEFKTIKNIISLENKLDKESNLQGITYDSDNDYLVLATGEYIYYVEKNGNIIKHEDLKKYSKCKSNGIAYNPLDKSLWVLFYSNYLINYNSNFTINSKIKINYKDQDHIYYNSNTNHLFITVGADYLENNNYVLEYDLNEQMNYKLYRINSSYAVEGIYLTDNKMYIVNDGFYHNAKIKKSYISVYDLTN